MKGPPWRTGIVAAAILAAGPAHGQGFFGPEGSASYQPEVDDYFRLAEGVRIQAQVQPTFVPAQQVSRLSFGLYGSWYVAAFPRELLSPDEAKNHAVDMRVGVLYDATLGAGTGSPGNLWTLQAEITPRYNLPAAILVSLRSPSRRS